MERHSPELVLGVYRAMTGDHLSTVKVASPSGGFRARVRGLRSPAEDEARQILCRMWGSAAARPMMSRSKETDRRLTNDAATLRRRLPDAR